MYKYIVFALLSLFLLSCSSSNDEIDKANISEIIYRIQEAYNQRELPVLMGYYHRDYLHSGKAYQSAYSTWEHRSTIYGTIAISVVDIEIYDEDFAYTQLMLYFYNDDTPIGPFTAEDISFFYRVDGKWQIYGNQLPE